MGNCLLSLKKSKWERSIFSNVTMQEVALSVSSSALIWTADEDCTVLVLAAQDTTTRGMNTWSVSGGDYRVIYNHADAHTDFTLLILEMAQGTQITVGYTPHKMRQISKISMTNLYAELLQYSSSVATSGGQYIYADAGTNNVSGFGGTVEPKANNLYLVFGAFGYHDVSDPGSKGFTFSDLCSNVTKSLAYRGAGTAKGGDGILSSFTSSFGWCGALAAAIIPSSDSSTFGIKPYVNKSYQSGAWAASWVFRVTQK